MGVMLDTVGKLIAGYLQKEVPGYEPFTPSDPDHLRGIIEPGDVMLVEGTDRVSGIINIPDAVGTGRIRRFLSVLSTARLSLMASSMS